MGDEIEISIVFRVKCSKRFKIFIRNDDNIKLIRSETNLYYTNKKLLVTNNFSITLCRWMSSLRLNLKAVK